MFFVFSFLLFLLTRVTWDSRLITVPWIGTDTVSTKQLPSKCPFHFGAVYQQEDVGQFGKAPRLIRPTHISPSLISYQSTAGTFLLAGYTDEIMLEWCVEVGWEIKLLDHSIHITSTPLESEIYLT